MKVSFEERVSKYCETLAIIENVNKSTEKTRKIDGNRKLTNHHLGKVKGTSDGK